MPLKIRFAIALSLLVNILSSCSAFQRNPSVSEVSPTPSLEVSDATQPETPHPSVLPSPPESNTVDEENSNVTKTGEPSAVQSPSPSLEPSKSTLPPPPEVPQLSQEEQENVNKIALEVTESAGFVTENQGLITMNRILLAQQAQWLISGSFSDDFKALEPNLPQETPEYKFEITQANDQATIVVAIAKNDKLPSFTGATYSVPAGLPVSGLCQSKLPSQTAPSPPELNGGKMLCGNDGVLVEN